MKQRIACRNFFLIIPITLIFHTTFAHGWQRYRNPSDKKPVHVTFSAFGPGIMFMQNHPGRVNISFPYQTQDLNGNKTMHTFTGSTDNLVSKQSLEMQVFSMDIGNPYYSLNFSAGFNTSYGGSYYSTGYGRNIYLGKKSAYSLGGKKSIQHIKKCTWVLRPSMNITFMSFSGGTVGYIDNTNTTIDLLGQHAGPTLKYSSGSGIGTTQHTTDADRLQIIYKQNAIGLQPKLAICSNPYKKRLSMQLFISYFLPLSEYAGLSLTQFGKNGHGDDNLIAPSGEVKLKNQHDLIATYNNHSFHNVPFHSNNVYIGIIFGINIASR
jgi:hypothetical protein